MAVISECCHPLTIQDHYIVLTRFFGLLLVIQEFQVISQPHFVNHIVVIV